MLVLSAIKGASWRMDKHPTCVITVLIVDQLGPNPLLCNTLTIYIFYGLFVRVRVCVCVCGFFLPQNVFFKLFLLDYGMTEVFTHSLSFVYKVNVELTSYRLSN